MGRLIGWLIFVLIFFGGAFGGAYYYQQQMNAKMTGKVESIATASLTGLKEQARLNAFVARYVAVVTSKQQRFGLSAERTMIMPGLVRYELDLKAIQQKDVRWDEKAKTLTITLPPLILSGPEVELEGIREYGERGILTALTDAEEVLDEANRKRAQDELLRQAKEAVPMRLAQDASRAAIERSFAMPLRAAGIKAAVVAQFAENAGEPGHAAEGHGEAAAPTEEH